MAITTIGGFGRGAKVVIGVGVFILLAIIVCNAAVICNARGRIYVNPDEIPSNRLGLLLGTSPVTPSGTRNLSFDYRIDAATELYKSGKIGKLIVSGGDYRPTEKYGCDEPRAMRDSLIANGVGPDDIFMDYEGLTTVKSLAKLANYYCYADTVTIISQGYHNQRAIAMADRLGLPSVAYSARVPSSGGNKIKNYLREALARVKMAFTLYLFPLPASDDFDSDDKEDFYQFLEH